MTVPGDGARTLWIAVAGSDKGAASARSELDAALANPDAALAQKVASRESFSRHTQLSLPGDQRLAEGIEWGKQNLRDLTLRADDLKIRDVDEGRAYPPAIGTVEKAHWIGAGHPDYPWIFATDAEYTAFAAVTVGQFEAIQDHARVLRDVSEMLNGNSGKVAHEVMDDGSVYFGSLKHAGNTDETAKFPSLVALVWRWSGDDGFRDDLYPFAVRNMRYVMEQLDSDGDGWPEGLGNVERSGMGEEKLDNTVYAIRGLYDLADMAQAKGDAATVTWAREKASDLQSRFEAAWWHTPALQYADSLDDPGDVQVFQKHWIGVTPMEAELTIDGRAWPGIASLEHGTTALGGREGECYSGERPYNLGLFHTGCGGGPDGRGRAHDLRAQHRDPGRRGGQLRPARRHPAEALHGRRGGADVRRALQRRRRGASHARHPGRAARRLAGDLPVAGLRRRGPARRERGALHALPLDGHAGLEPVRDHVAGRAPAARRATGPRPPRAIRRWSPQVPLLVPDRRRAHPARRRLAEAGARGA